MSKFLSPLLVGGACAAAMGFALPSAAAIIDASDNATVESSGGNENEDAAGYLHVRREVPVGSSVRKAYFQFDLTGQNADLDEGGTLTFTLQNGNNDQVLQLWGLNQAYTDFDQDETWEDAQANDLASNDLLTTGAFTATAIGSSFDVDAGAIGVGGTFTASVGDLTPYVFGDVATFVLTGADDTGASVTNSNGGLRIQFSGGAAGQNTPATLTFDQVPEPGSMALIGLGGLAMLTRRRTGRSA